VNNIIEILFIQHNERMRNNYDNLVSAKYFRLLLSIEIKNNFPFSIFIKPQYIINIFVIHEMHIYKSFFFSDDDYIFIKKTSLNYRHKTIILSIENHTIPFTCNLFILKTNIKSQIQEINKLMKTKNDLINGNGLLIYFIEPCDDFYQK
jgi:hypothetical protein